MLRILWTDKVANKAVLEHMGNFASLESQVTYQRSKYLGHVMRHENMGKKLILGITGGAKQRYTKIAIDGHCEACNRLMNRKSSDKNL